MSYGSFSGGGPKPNTPRSRPPSGRHNSYTNGYNGSAGPLGPGEVLPPVPTAPLALRHSSTGRTDENFVAPPPGMWTPQMRSQRLIGNSNPRYEWSQYFKPDSVLRTMKQPIRAYYERNNTLIQQYIYIDKLLDSSLPHNLIQEYHQLAHSNEVRIPPTIIEKHSLEGSSAFSHESESQSSALVEMRPDSEAESSSAPRVSSSDQLLSSQSSPEAATPPKIVRTPQNLYKIPITETTGLMSEFNNRDANDANNSDPESLIPEYSPDDDTIDSSSSIVTLAIRINLAANFTLLILKIAVTLMTSSVSVLASLVDAALDFLSTAIVWTTTFLISRQDDYSYPAGRRRLEPIGVLVFSVIMTTSFIQVGIEGIKKLTSGEKEVVQLPPMAIIIMGLTVLIKFGCWFWCRLVKNSSVQALAQDAMTDVVFNIFSIIFPLLGYLLNIWWLDPLGGIALSIYVIVNWTETSFEHIRNLSGAAATSDERNVLLYLTMRFAKTIEQIQGLTSYHAGDKLIVEVDIVVDENMLLRDSHDLGESLQYMLESVPIVDRAFVHLDYASYNLPTHMRQQE